MALYTPWTIVSKSIASIGFCSTSISSLIFLTLSVYYVHTNYKCYQRYMIVFSMLGFALAAVEFAVNPIFHTYNYGFMMFSLAHPFGASTDKAFDLLLIYTCLYAATISFLTVQFLYRYTAILHPSLVPCIFGTWRIIPWILYSLYFGVQWSLGVIYFAELDDVAISYMKDEVWSYYGYKIQEIAMCAIVAYDEDKRLRWYNLLCIVNMSLIMLVQYGIIMFCGFRMSVSIRNTVSHLSPVLLKLHTQFFRVLVLQILVPTLTLFMPVFILMFTPLLNLQLRFPSGVLLSLFSFFPAMDAIIVMYILSDYKNVIKRMCGLVSETVQGAMGISVVESTASSRVTPSQFHLQM